MSRISFNYEVIVEADTRKRVESEAKQIKVHLQRSGEAVVNIGHRLRAVKELLKPSLFRTWIETEFCWQIPTAWNYMQAAEAFGDAGEALKNFQPFGIVSLSRKNVPREVQVEAIQLAQKGQQITGKVAARLIQAAGVQPTHVSAGKARKPLTAVVAAVAAASSPMESVAALKSTLDNFTNNLAMFAEALDKTARDELADKFFQMAMQLRGLTTPAAATSSAPGARKRVAALV